MEDIYDRSKWPTPEANPLVQLLLRPGDWVTNNELATALELVNTTRSKSVVGHYRSLVDEIGPENTKLERGGKLVKHGHLVRYFTKKALVRIAMRSQTKNAEAFRDWVATRVAEEFAHG
jgi:prophage antirepressor-like protein